MSMQHQPLIWGTITPASKIMLPLYVGLFAILGWVYFFADPAQADKPDTQGFEEIHACVNAGLAHAGLPVDGDKK